MACAVSSPRRRVQTTDSRRAFPIAPNLPDRKFTAAAPNQVWLADLTYIATEEGWLYMAAVMDLHTRKILGWSMREHLRAELATSALLMAIKRQRPGPGLVQHSDRGVQYACDDYQMALEAAGIIPSMSRWPNPLDNAPMESLFHTLETELVIIRPTPPGTTPNATCSRMSRASTIASASIRPWTTARQTRQNGKQQT